MHIYDGFVATVTYVVGFFSLSGVENFGIEHQTPLVDLPNELVNVAYGNGPVFRPPTGRPIDLPGGDLVCNYTAMGADWTSCSAPGNRGCWLSNKRTGAEYNIHTDYEDPSKLPTGIDRYYTLNVTDGWINADGMNFTEGKFFWNVDDPDSKLPQNRYPGPWVQACWGDRVHINVVNNLTFNGTSVHWHGIRQLNSSEADGVPGVTQCPIAPNDNFTYSWVARQYGSSWYHSHYSLQYADGALGPLTIHGPSSDDWDEPKFPILMTDWGHNSAFQAIWPKVGLKNESTLLNGRGNVSRYDNTVRSTTQIPSIYSIRVASTPAKARAKRYLLRLINTSFESIFIFSIDNHNLTVVSSDFVSVAPYNTTNVTISIGQRYNAILIAQPINSSARSFWMRAYRPKCFNANTIPSVGYEKAGIVYYDDAMEPPSEKAVGWPVDTSNCTDEPYSKLHPVVPWTVDHPPANEEDHLTVHTGPGGFNPGVFPLALFSIGGDDFNPFQIDYGNPIFVNMANTGKWPPKWVVYPENYNSTSWVYLVLKGLHTGTNANAHPIHLHGHDFAILQQAYNQTYPAGLNPNFNNPPRRDVVLLPSDGYAIIAFRTDNPGPWIMHCHIAQHASFGLALQVLERQFDAESTAVSRGAVTQAQRTCNKWNKWYGDCNNWWYDTNPASGQSKGQWCDFGEQGFSPDSGV